MAGIIATLLSAVLFWGGTGLHPVWWLTWLAPLPVLWYARRALWKAAATAAFVALLAGGFNMWVYLHRLIGLPVLVTLFVLTIPAVVFAVAVLLWRAEIRSGRVWRAALWPPLVWVAYEYLSTIASPHSTFGSLAYSQMDCLPVLQLASLTGIWGIVFLLFLVPSTVAALFTKWNRPLAITLGALMIAAIGFGVSRLLVADAGASRPIRLALIASDAPPDRWAKNERETLAILSRYAARVESVHGADAIVLPEDLGPVPSSAAEQARQILSTAAARSGAELVVGLRERQAPPMLNEALVFRSDGTLQATYEKHHMIPRLEDGIVVGRDIAVLPSPRGVQGVQICKDLDFPALSREYAVRSVGLLLVPAWDFTVDGWLHDRMAVMRGVESGFSIARAARQGLLTLSDNRGRVLLERATSPNGFVVAEGAVRLDHARTLYALAGDWFAWCALAALLALIVFRGGRNAHLAR